MLLVILAVMTMASAVAQTNTAHAFETTPLSVVGVTGDSYTWELYNEVTGINFATVPGNCPADQAFFVQGINTGPTVNVTWLKPGIYFFKVTASRAGGTNNIEIGKVEVLPGGPTAILAMTPGEICIGESANLKVTFTGNAPWSIRLRVKDKDGTNILDYTDISADKNPLEILVNPKVTTEYTVVEVTDLNGNSKDSSNTVALTVNPLPRSSRIYLKNSIAAAQEIYVPDKVCKGALRTYRINGEETSTYTWILTGTAGDTIALTKPEGVAFTDVDKDGVTIHGSEIEINWEHAPGVYTLKVAQRNATGCKTIETGTVEIVPQAIVLAGADLSVCSGSTVALTEAQASDYASLEWTTTGDGVFNFTSQLNPVYTPGTADIAAGSVTLTLKGTGLGNTGSCSDAIGQIIILINPVVKPLFSAIGPLWQNSTPPALPATSTNGIKGTWTPASINTTTIATTSYKFTPDAGQCAVPDSILIVVNPLVTPTFDAIGPFCATSTATALPLNSTNNLKGTWRPAEINTSVAGTFQYTFTPDADQGGITVTRDIVITPLTEPLFDLIGELWLNSAAPTLATTSKNNISGTWDPATINTSVATTTLYTFTPNTSQCASVKTISIVVKTLSIPTFDPIGPFCQNSTPTVLPSVSTNGIRGTWTPDKISTVDAGASEYTFEPESGQQSASVAKNILVTPTFVAEFDSIGPLWQNSTAPKLPELSRNNFNGTWQPAIINTSIATTTTYTFTPAAGQCAARGSITITIKPLITPIFETYGPYCLGTINEPLPTTSINGITGTWNPATIDPNTLGSFPYVFTPDDNQGSQPVTINVVMVAHIVPTFNQISSVWQNSTPPALPAVSTNRIQGTWSPATIETATTGTTTYIFNSNAGQCAGASRMDITVLAPGTPIFDTIGQLCQNSTPPVLPRNSKNNIAGTWTPSVISTTVPGTTSYTFRPTNTQGTVPVTINIQVNPLTTPEFDPIGPLELNFSAPALPLESKNDITGKWNPSTISTASAGKKDYVFTPDAGQCASIISMTIEVKTIGRPTFNAIGPFCLNSTPTTLPGISANNIAGTWSPSEISTAAIGTFRFTFTPDANQGSEPVTINIQIVTQVAPTFNQMGPFWVNSAPLMLPTTSTNGFTGTWDPSMVNTGVVGKTTYRFTPDAGQCSTSGTMDITINQLGTPVFDPLGPYCMGSTPVSLPVMSTNGIAGTWAPSIVSTNATGSFKFTFTPDQVQGSEPVTIEISVTEAVLPIFDTINPICQKSAPVTLPTHSLNGFTGSWYPAVVNTSYAGSFTFNFTPDADQCAKPYGMIINITPTPVITISPVSPLCSGSSAIELTATPAGGTFSGPGVTGTTFNPTLSGAGIFTVTYSIQTDCGTIKSSIFITVTKEPDATISYTGTPFCPTSPITAVNLTGATGGTFTATPDGLDIDQATGDITPETSNPGIYLITCTIAASGGCQEVKITTTVQVSSATLVISDPIDQTVTYPDSTGFGVKAIGYGLTYQWQVDDGTGFKNVTDNTIYSGSLTDSLRLASPTASLSGYKYRIIAGGLCTPPDTSKEAILKVKIKPIDLKLTITGIDKIYDGLITANISLSYTAQSGDSITVTYAKAAFENKNAGIDKTILVEGIKIGGKDGQKYAIGGTATTTATISKKSITVSAMGDTKEYDGNVISEKTPTAEPGLAVNDSGHFTQTFADKNYGTGIILTPFGTVSDGNNGDNYMIDYKKSDMGVILQKTLAGSFTAESKVYDGTVDAIIQSRSLNGVISGETVNLVGGIATFDTPDAGFGKMVTARGLFLEGVDIKNYLAADSATTTADIFIKPLSTDLIVNKKTFSHYSDLVTLTATVQGGAELSTKLKAANTATFYIEGQLLRDGNNNSNIPVIVSGKDLIANLTLSLIETTTTGILEAGTKEVKAQFSEENSNYSLSPNPARSSLEFNPGFTLNVFPNPTPGPVSFRIAVDVGSMATLDLYTASGELVARVFEGYINAGESKTIPFKANLAQGMYRYRAIIGNEVKFGNVIIIAVY
jgi:hypothetical protein